MRDFIISCLFQIKWYMNLIYVYFAIIQVVVIALIFLCTTRLYFKINMFICFITWGLLCTSFYVPLTLFCSCERTLCLTPVTGNTVMVFVIYITHAFVSSSQLIAILLGSAAAMINLCLVGFWYQDVTGEKLNMVSDI